MQVNNNPTQSANSMLYKWIVGLNDLLYRTFTDPSFPRHVFRPPTKGLIGHDITRLAKTVKARIKIVEKQNNCVAYVI